MKPHMPTIQLEQTLPFSHIFYIILFFFSRNQNARVLSLGHPPDVGLFTVPFSEGPFSRDGCISCGNVGIFLPSSL